MPQPKIQLSSQVDTTFAGAAGWEDIRSSFIGARLGAGSAAPTWAVLQGGVYGYTFSATAMNECWLTMHIPHNYAPGTVLYPHIHWAPSGANVGVVRWGIEYTLAKGYNQQAFPATTTIYIEQASSAITLRHMIGESPTIPATNIEPDVVVMCRVFRDAVHANDTLTDAAFALEVDLHYQVQGVSTVNRNYPFS